MKRTLFIILCLVFVITITASIAFATAYASGYYNGYQYNASLSRTSNYVSASMTYNGNSTLYLNGSYSYEYIGALYHKPLKGSGVSSASAYGNVPSDGSSIGSYCAFYVYSSMVTSLTD